MNALSRFADPVYCVLRLIAGLMLATHGAQKVFGMFGGKVAGLAHMQFAGWVELVGGLLVAIGLATRPAAFLCSGVMAAAYFMGHFSVEVWHPVINKGELAVVYCFLFLFIFFYGPGRYSLDSMIFRNRANDGDFGRRQNPLT